MPVSWPDQPFIHWAIQRGFSYYYTNEHGLPERCLKLHIGVMTAYIYQGKLVRIVVDSEGHLLDEMMLEFAQLFAECARHDAYLDQALCTTDREHHSKSNGDSE